MPKLNTSAFLMSVLCRTVICKETTVNKNLNAAFQKIIDAAIKRHADLIAEIPEILNVRAIIAVII